MVKTRYIFLVITTCCHLLIFSGLSFADIFEAVVHVKADNEGVVTITGGERIAKLVQFCPDEFAKGCDYNITIGRDGNSFVLDKDGLAHHQTVFNFMDSLGNWLRIPHEKVICDGNVRCETNKGYFTYTGAAAKK